MKTFSCDPAAPLQLYTSRVCRGCSLLCDDVSIRLTPNGGLTVQESLCQLGTQHYREVAAAQLKASCQFLGKPVEYTAAIATAVEWLQTSRGQTLFAGMEHLTTAAQQELVRLVGSTGGWMGPCLSGPGPAEVALTRHGRSTATLGELHRQPGVAILFAHREAVVPPRLFDRFVATASSRWIVGDWVPPAPAASPQAAGPWLRVDKDLSEVLPGLRYLRAMARTSDVASAASCPSPNWQRLAEAVNAAPGVVVFVATHGRSTDGPDFLVDGLHQWTHALNRQKPASLLPLDAAANSLSAGSVLTWTWGLAAGGAVAGGELVRSAGFETVVDRVRAGQYEVLFWIDGVENRYPTALVEALPKRGDRRLVVLASRQSFIASLSDLLLPVAEPGYDDGGDFWRLDELSVRLEPLMSPQRPTASAVLKAITNQLAHASPVPAVSLTSP